MGVISIEMVYETVVLVETVKGMGVDGEKKRTWD